ncbi:MAG: nuclear transport factor 2 family protein, partial [Actinomycetota bacterium]|nr:nuclear transport factor 2 family protein [Actinomycetota bacterium]
PMAEVENPRKHRSRKWLYVLLAVLVLVGAVFVAGMWFADRGERAVESVTEPYFEAYGGLDTPKDVPGLLPLYAEDAVFRDAAADRTHRGPSEIEDALNSLLATPDFDLTIDGTRVGDDWALVSWTADGTKPELGRVTQVEGVTVLEIADGMIERETWYYDPAKAPF